MLYSSGSWMCVVKFKANSNTRVVRTTLWPLCYRWLNCDRSWKKKRKEVHSFDSLYFVKLALSVTSCSFELDKYHCKCNEGVARHALSIIWPVGAFLCQCVRLKYIALTVTANVHKPVKESEMVTNLETEKGWEWWWKGWEKQQKIHV